MVIHMTKRTIAVIGAGNGGQAMAGHLAMQGHAVRLYARHPDRLPHVCASKTIQLTGAVTGVGRLAMVTDSLAAALDGADIIMVVTTADAHGDVARAMAPHLRDGHVVVLNPGRTGGALEVRHVLRQCRVRAQVYVAEAQSLVYACRIETPGCVTIIGVKDHVLLAALPAADTVHVLAHVAPLYPCFQPAPHVVATSLENIGAIFHPAIVVCNAAAIERGVSFHMYEDMTPAVARLITTLDAERCAIGAAYGLQLRSAADWIAHAYRGIAGDDLCSRMRNNPAYARILAPTTLRSRMLLEDIPAGILPMTEFARLARVATPCMHALLAISEALLGDDLLRGQRTLAQMGVSARSVDQLLRSL